MCVKLKKVELRKIDITTRMPFRYGITTLTNVPYSLVFTDFEVAGKRIRGVAADVLPPKWFTKQPDASIADELSDMLKVIRTACVTALQLREQETVFRWWSELYQQVMSSSELEHLPPLLKGFGVSLLERAAIDATCRRYTTTFHRAVHSDLLGISLEDFHSELKSLKPAELLPKKPQAEMHIRHTVGLLDPLFNGEITNAERLTDGLPQSLDACIEHYGIKYLKIKIPADLDAATERLNSIADLIQASGQEIQFTLDGNECFKNPTEFREFWKSLNHNKKLKAFFDDGLIVVEQPLHRDVALLDETSEVFHSWADRPSLIIDESDGEIGSLRQALVVGYSGTSHKNCKGIFKGLANACLLNYLNHSKMTNRFVCTGEDLMNLGPVALLQDFAVGATIGFTHTERNGHHYVAGLAQFPDEIKREIIMHHGDLYREHRAGDASFPSLAIDQGQVSLESINQAPFGYAIAIDESKFELLEGF
jgi:hypothetical protein